DPAATRNRCMPIALACAAGDFARAESLCRAAQSVDRVNGTLWLGFVMRDQGRNDEALACFDEVVKLDANHIDAHYGKGQGLLVKGESVNGWKESEWRLQRPDHRTQFPQIPEWHGENSRDEDLRGKTILVEAEQGIGDTFQFVRYLRLLRARGCYVLL